MLQTGRKVKVMIPMNEQTAGVNVKQFNGKVTTIKSTKHYTQGSLNVHTLDGCASDMGCDYFFIEEWLIPMESEVSE